MAPEEANIPILNAKGIKYVQAIVGAVLFYWRAVDKKWLVSLINMGTKRAPATESTNEAINHLLEYLTNYPDDGIVYRSSNMVLAAH